MKQQMWNKTILLAASGTIVVWLLLCGLLAWIAERELLNLETAKWLTIAGANGILLLGCWLTASKAGKGRLSITMAVVGVVLVCCLLMKLTLFSTCPMGLDLRIILPLITAAAAGLLASRRKVRRK